MCDNFDYNRMILAPIGCPCQVHVTPKNCKSWDFHSQKGYYLFTLGKHYCMDNIFMKDTRAEQLSDTVTFQHPTVLVISHADRIIRAITALVHLIKGMTKGIPKGARKNKINMPQPPMIGGNNKTYHGTTAWYSRTSSAKWVEGCSKHLKSTLTNKCATNWTPVAIATSTQIVNWYRGGREITWRSSSAKCTTESGWRAKEEAGKSHIQSVERSKEDEVGKRQTGNSSARTKGAGKSTAYIGSKVANKRAHRIKGGHIWAKSFKEGACQRSNKSASTSQGSYKTNPRNGNNTNGTHPNCSNSIKHTSNTNVGKTLGSCTRSGHPEACW